MKHVKWLLFAIVFTGCRDCYCELGESEHFWLTQWAKTAQIQFISGTGELSVYKITNVIDSEREVYPHMLLCEGTDALGEISVDEYVVLEWQNTQNPGNYFEIDIDCNGLVFGWNERYQGHYTDWSNSNIMRYDYRNYTRVTGTPFISIVNQVKNYVKNGVDYNRCIMWSRFNLETGDTLSQFVISRDLGPIYIQPEGQEGMLRKFDWN